MDFIKRYLFWVVLAVVVGVAAIAYFLIVPPIWAQTAQLEQDCKDRNKSVRDHAKKPSSIRTLRHVKAAKAFRAHLRSEEKNILDLWKKNVRSELSPRFKAAPQDNLRFDSWLIELRNEIMKTAAQAHLRLPKDFKTKYLFDKTTTRPEEREARLRQVALIYEIVGILSRVRVSVTRYKFNPEMKKEEGTQTVNVGPLSLDALEIVSGEAQKKSKLDVAGEALKLAGSNLTGRGAEFPEPYNISGINLRFTAPSAAVRATLRALESCPRYFAVITRIDSQRVAAPYPSTGQLAAAAPGVKKKAETASPRNVNTHYEEAPVQVQVQMDLLTFDEKAARKMAALPKPAPKKRKGRRKPAARKKAK